MDCMTIGLLLGLLSAYDHIEQQRITILVEQLGDGHYRAREDASAALDQVMRKAFPQLQKAAQHRDPEVAARARRLLDGYYARLLPSDYPKAPWIDMLPPMYPEREEIKRKYLSMASHASDTDYTNYREATQIFIRDMVENYGWSPERAIHLMDEMAANEKAWMQANKRLQAR